MKASCDICGKYFKWKEAVIAFHNDNGTYFVECLDCAEQYQDNKVYPDKNWEVHKIGETLYLLNPHGEYE